MTEKKMRSVVAIGNFDGVHAGHKALLAKARTVADTAELPLVVLTFEPHPKAVFFPDQPLQRLTTADEKIALLLENGADDVHVVPFTRAFAQTTADEFMQDLLVDALGAAHVVVGEDFRFGFKAAGDVRTLQKNPAFTTHILQDVCDEAGERYSSRRLREG